MAAQEAEAKEWIERILGIAFESTFAESLKDGAILCRCVTPNLFSQTLKGDRFSQLVTLSRLAIAIYAKAGRPLVLKINEPATFKPLTMASKKVLGVVIFFCIMEEAMDQVLPLPQMENITNAIKAFRALGMKEFEMFSTLDLYEEKNIQQV